MYWYPAMESSARRHEPMTPRRATPPKATQATEASHAPEPQAITQPETQAIEPSIQEIVIRLVISVEQPNHPG